LETKFYAKGIGNILAIDETTGEREELVFFREGDDDDDEDRDDASGCGFYPQDRCEGGAFAAFSADWDFA
jgi:hypothetical protein